MFEPKIEIPKMPMKPKVPIEYKGLNFKNINLATPLAFNNADAVKERSLF